VKPLGELFAFKNGVNAERHAYGTGVRFVNVLETITHSHLKCDDVAGRVALPASIRATYAVRRGDVLFNRTSETDSELALAATYVDSEEVVFGGFVIRGRPTSDEIDPNYCGYALRARALRAQIIPLGQGAVRANIGQASLGRVLAPVPTVAEQRAIGEAIGDVDALLVGLDRLIAKKRDLKQAAMQQLLTGQTRLPGFQGEWKVRRMGDMLTVCHGRNQREVETVDGLYPILATGGQIGTASRALYDKPSVLIGRKGTINQPRYMDKPFWTVDTLFYSAMKDDHNAKYLSYRFCLIDWMQYNEASGVPSLNARTIERVEVPAPEPKEQAAIAGVLTDMDSELAALEARRNKTRALKQGMMQELLTGRTRLA
jgi:type I restriction enzyme S subunit